MPVGLAVTLRGDRAYEFLDRLFSVAMPRIRDFRGVNPRSFDGRGNYTLGVREQTIFPEIDYDEVDQTRGLDITITTTAAPTPRRSRCSRRSGCRSPRTAARPAQPLQRRQPELREHNGQDFTAGPPSADPKFKTRGYTPLPPLRPLAFRVPQVRRVPDLPARACSQRIHPRHDEVELVGAIACR